MPRPTTSDPVSLAEIAERTGLDRNRVKGMRARGDLPDPDWELGVGGLWAWEGLEDHPIVRRCTDPIRHYAHVLVAIGQGGARLVRYELPDERGRVRTATRRIEAHGHGWVTIPTAKRHRLVITDDLGEVDASGVAVEVGTRNETGTAAHHALTALRDLYVSEADTREPAVCPLWS